MGLCKTYVGQMGAATFVHELNKCVSQVGWGVQCVWGCFFL